MISPIISQEPFIPHLFEQLDQSDQAMLEKSEYEGYVAWFNQCDDAVFERIVYWSDGLRIVGIISRPKSLKEGQCYPIIIYNRGGAGEAGKVTVRTLCKRIYPLIQLGYVVIASQYRGNDGSEGSDEIGGADVNDVLSLLPVMQSLPYVACENMFMLGFSRGAVDMYRALQKNVLPIKACAVMSGISDLFSFEQLRPDLVMLLEHFIPHYHTNRIAELTKRSAVCWAEDLSAPLLLLHGEEDDMVDVSTTKNLANKLDQYNKQYELIVYPKEDHSFDMYHDQAVAEIHNWFMKYKQG